MMPRWIAGTSMRATRTIPLLLFLAVTILCVVLDVPTRGGSAWAFAGITLASALLVVFWRGGGAPVGERGVRGAAHRCAPASQDAAPPSTFELLRAGLVLGFTGFGGGLAVLSQVERRLVERERWTDGRGFAEAMALGQSLPGAISTNTLGFIGWRLARLRGALALQTGFVLPSFVMLLVFALLYARVRQLAVVAGMFHLLDAAVAGLVGAMTMRLAAQVVTTPANVPAGLRGLLRDRWSLFLALGSALAVAVFGLGVPEVVLAAGLLGLARHFAPEARSRLALLPVAPALVRLAAVAAGVGPAGAAGFGELQRLGALASVFLRAGAVTFGGGYVIVPLLEAELVRGRHWLTPQAFVDAMTLGQVTPGPVVITSTFVGYTLGGLAGALVATMAVFLPALGLVLLVGVSLDRFRASPGIQAFLRGLQPAVAGLMAAATATLVRHGVRDALAAGVAAAAFLLLWRLRVNPMWVVLGAGLLGVVRALLARA
jgi:chromate transporter